MPRRFIRLVLIVSVTLFCFVGILPAQERHPASLSDDQTRAILELLKEKGIITEEEATAFMQRIRGPQIPAGGQPKLTGTEKTPKPEPATQQDVAALQEKFERTSGATMLDHRLLTRRIDDMEAGVLDQLVDKSIKSEWAQRITISGDVRLRYQQDAFVDGNAIFVNPDDTSRVMNTTEDRHRFRYRARLGLKARLVDYREINVGQVETGFRFTTGNEEDPVSTNDTMGDYFNRDSLVFDRAYLKWKWHPINPWFDRMPQISIVGGRFANPWFSTDLVWDGDLNFEGLAVSYETDTEQMRPMNLFFTAGVFPLQEEEFSNRDKWLWGAQVGLQYQPSYNMAFALSAAYYDYQNVEGIQNTLAYPNENNFTAPLYQQKGNTLMDIDPEDTIQTALATDYNILDILLKTDIGIFHPIHIILDAQYVKNFGFDADRVAEVTGDDSPVEDTDGYMFGAMVGYPKISNFGEWNVGLKYKYLGADAVLDAFTDSDFHLGGTNAKGWILNCEYGLYRNLWLTARWLSSDEIKGPQFGVDTLQVDFNARF
ncbi:putative porin [Desulfosarcina cetonica]|uniref:putative porin n=1 Tax=Desulfosarcina cetonica TaxID=90730 RepID=UPI0009FA4CFB|nr:putative porin [Desulfosarcina cetonica]